MSDLIPADPKRCQCEITPPHNFMSFGPKPKPERCKNAPVFIAVEVKPGKDGLCGEMSLCMTCAQELWKDLDLRDRIEFKPIPEEK